MPANAGLPYELRQVVQRYPVTLYTGEECGPCSMARTLLITRGIPFDERTVKSNAEIDALQRLSSQSSLPLLTIGSQQLKGFSDAEWSQYLDAAGYPKSNSLPPGYRNGLARPLVAQQAAPAPAAPTAPAAQPAPPSAPSSEPSPSNPAGIKF
jgi:glutaredoxin